MKNIKRSSLSIISLTAIFTFLFYACGTTVNFPVSQTLPTADVKAKVKKDKNNIYKIEVEADHLADPERLTPEKKRYIVWLMDVDGENHRIGELKPDNSKEAELYTVTPYKPIQIFITAENKKDPVWPSTQVVFRSETFDAK